MNTQKEHRKKSISVRIELIDLLERLYSNVQPRFENNRYSVKFTIDGKKGKLRKLMLNNPQGTEDCIIEAPYNLNTVITVKAEVVIPVSQMVPDYKGAGWHPTGRYLIIVIRFRSSAKERYKQDLADFHDIIKKSVVTLNGVKKQISEDDVEARETCKSVLSNNFGHLIDDDFSYMEAAEDENETNRDMTEALRPYTVMLAYYRNDPKNIGKINCKNPKTGGPRVSTCYRALSYDYGDFQNVYNELASVIFERFKTEQNNKLILSFKEFVEEYKKGANNGLS